MMLKPQTAFAFLAIAVMISCSDDDGSDVLPKGPPGTGGSAGDGMSGAAGTDTAGSGGASGSSGAGGGGSGGGPPDCTPIDAGAPDAGDAGDVAGDAGLGDASADGGVSGVVSFAADIHPIFVARCGPCHVNQFAAGHNVGSADIDEAYGDAVEHSQALLVRTNGGGMPPSYAEPPNNCSGGLGDPGCLTVQEYALLQTWVAQCYPR